MSQIIYLTPFFSQRVWGGQKLTEYGFKLPDHNKYGEAWVISGMTNAKSSMISDSNQSFRDFYQENQADFNKDSTDYPLLAKIINAESDLSIQVHPTDQYAQTHHNYARGKAECWYVLDCLPNATITYGHTAQTRSELKMLLQTQQWDRLFKQQLIKPGDFINIPAGKVHGLSAGTVVYELQQACDITYRLHHTYHITAANAAAGMLHIKDGCAVAQIPDSDLIIKNINQGVLVDQPAFYCYLLNSAHTNKLDTSLTNYLQITMLAGTGTIDGHPLHQGQSAIIYNIGNQLLVNGKIKAILAYKKRGPQSNAT